MPTRSLVLLSVVVLLLGVLPAAPTEDPAFHGPSGTIFRLEGPSRIETAVDISQQSFGAGSAPGAVLTSADNFPDAQAGATLAAWVAAGPLLLTGAAGLHDRTAEELQRAVAPGGVVYVLGGVQAVPDHIENAVRTLGFRTERLSGSTRDTTAIAIAERTNPNPQRIFIADGDDFTTSLIAGPAAARAVGAGPAVIVLTRGATLPGAVGDYLSAQQGAELIALGSNAATAVPQARAITAPTPAALSIEVAQEFFDNGAFAGGAPTFGLASADNWPDGLAGGANAGTFGFPLLLTPATALDEAVRDFIAARSWASGVIYGGTAAINQAVEDAVASAVGEGGTGGGGGGGTIDVQGLEAVTEIAGLAAWYRATDGVLTDPNGPVVQWLDQSGNGHHLVVADEHVNPSTEGFPGPGCPSVVIKADDWMVADSLDLGPEATVFASHFADSLSRGGSDRALYDLGGQRTAGFLNGDEQWSVGPFGVGEHEASVVTAERYDPGGGTQWFYRERGDGTLQQGGFGGQHADTNDGLWVGAPVGGSTDGWDGWVGELIVYRRALSDAEVGAVLDYLADRWVVDGTDVGAPSCHDPLDDPIDTPGGPGASEAGVEGLGPALWLRADTGVETTDGVSVQSWSDRRGTGMRASARPHPLVANSTGRPSFRADQFSNCESILFGSSSLLGVQSGSSSVSFTPPVTVVAAWYTSYLGGTPDEHHKLYGSDAGGFGMAAGVDGRAPGQYSVHTGAGVDGLFDVISGDPTITSEVWSGGTVRWRVRAGQLIADGATSGGAPSADAFYVGSSGPSFVEGWDGTIAEFLVFDEALTDDQLDQVEGYLAGRYGIGVAGAAC